MLLSASLFANAFLLAALISVWNGRASLVRVLRAREEKLTALAKGVADSSAQWEQFRSRLKHDLRSPLQGILGYADLLAAEKGGALNQKQKQFLEHIRAGAQKIVDVLEVEHGDNA